MEEDLFTGAAVAAQMKEKFVEARLHTDFPKMHAEQIKKLQDEVARSPANPIFVVVDPETEREVTRVEGYVKSELIEMIENPRGE